MRRKKVGASKVKQTNKAKQHSTCTSLTVHGVTGIWKYTCIYSTLAFRIEKEKKGKVTHPNHSSDKHTL